jgi:hypothetical protein
MEDDMLYWTLTLLVIAFNAAFFGFGDLGSAGLRGRRQPPILGAKSGMGSRADLH